MTQLGEPIPFVITKNMEFKAPTNYSKREYYEELVLQHVVIYIYRQRMRGNGERIGKSDSPTLTELDEKIHALSNNKYIPNIAMEIFKRIKSIYNIKATLGERYEEEGKYEDDFLVLFMSYRFSGRNQGRQIETGIVKIYSSLSEDKDGKWFNIVFSDDQIYLYHHA